MAPTNLVGDTLEDHMQMYESLWRERSGEREDQELPSTFDFGKQIVETRSHQRLGHMSEIMTSSLMEEHGVDRLWMERELQDSALRINDLEKFAGEPDGDSALIWTSISSLSSRIRHIEDTITATLNTKVEAIESLELDVMLQVMEGVRNGMTEDTMDISTRRMDEVAAEQVAKTAASG